MSAPKPNAWVSKSPIYVAGKHGKDAIVLSANENPLGASPKAKQALQSFDVNRYPEGSAESLRQAIAKKHAYPADQIACGAGSDELITLLVRAYCSQGDEIIHSEHGFLLYAIAAQLVGAKPVKAKEANYTCDTEAILSAITDKTKIIFIANPNNPTGTYLNEATLQAFIKKVPSHILIVVDSAYAEYVEATDYNAGDIAKDSANVVMLRTFSKLYGLASLRVGWMLASKDVIATINQARNPFNLSQPAQVAAIQALGDESHIKESLDLNRRNKLRLQKALQQLGLGFIESHGNFLAVNFSDEASADSHLQYLQESNILVRSIKAYGLPEFLRITIGTDSETDALIQALQDFHSQNFHSRG